MNIEKISAFSENRNGGNPAGVALLEQMPSEDDMLKIATQVGFSETAFAVPVGNNDTWRVRYFAPEIEVPFCGHATIALGAVLAKTHGPKTYTLELNDSQISVEGKLENGEYFATLQSPATNFKELPEPILKQCLNLFNLDHSQISNAIPPALVHAGGDHLLLVLNDHDSIRTMNYDLQQGKEFMLSQQIATVMLVYAESPELFHVRNAFASGGVYEDPATGSAAAAFTGYLRDAGLAKSEGKLTLVQGEDMGARSLIHTEFSMEKGSSIRVSGAAHQLPD